MRLPKVLQAQSTDGERCQNTQLQPSETEHTANLPWNFNVGTKTTYDQG
jgi:hypothetical protein